MPVDNLTIIREYSIGPGIQVIDVKGKFPVTGSICRIDLQQHDFRVFCFHDLINKSLLPRYGCFTEVPINLGASIRGFINGNRHECEGIEGYPLPDEWRRPVRNNAEKKLKEARQYAPPYLDYYRKCLIGSNTLQTNFIRPNGFAIVEGKIVAKPPHAPGRYDPDYTKLGPAGHYTCLLVDNQKHEAKIEQVLLNRKNGGPNYIEPWAPNSPQLYGFASPRLIKDSKIENSKGKPWLETHTEPHRTDDDERLLMGDWVEWDVESTARSFTAFGVESDPRFLVMASIFEGQWGAHTLAPPPGNGILPKDFAELLVSGEYRVHVSDAVLGGGSGDAQQFVHGRYPRFREGPVAIKIGTGTGEVEGVRGMGAIAAVLPSES